MDGKKKKGGKEAPQMHNFAIARNYPRTKSYTVIKPMHVDAFAIFGKTVSRIFGRKKK